MRRILRNRSFFIFFPKLLVLFMTLFSIIGCSNRAVNLTEYFTIEQQEPEQEPEEEPLPDPITTGQLTIVNGTSYDIVFVRWISDDGSENHFNPDSVWDSILNKNVGGIQSGNNATMTVQIGSSPIYFFLSIGGKELYTQDIVTVEAEKEVTYELSDGTKTYENASIQTFALSNSTIEMGIMEDSIQRYSLSRRKIR